jgi:hypothetical protein
VITIFGTTYFTIGAGLVVLVLAAPLLFWFSRWLWRPNVESKPRRVRWLAVGGTTLGLLLLVAVGLFWDVYLIGQRAKELCRETGLVVYRQAPAKSFVGSTDIRSWSRDGFEFVEAVIEGKLFRLTLVGDKEVRTEIPHFESAHELSLSMTHPANDGDFISRHFMVIEHRIFERITRQPLAAISSVTIENGWLDRLVIGRLGFVADPHVCGKDIERNVVVGPSRIGIAEMVRKTLIH